MSLLLAVDVGNTNIVMGIYDLGLGDRAPVLHAWRLATSRERLGISGEATYRLPPLEGPEAIQLWIASQRSQCRAQALAAIPVSATETRFRPECLAA